MYSYSAIPTIKQQSLNIDVRERQPIAIFMLTCKSLSMQMLRYGRREYKFPCMHIHIIIYSLWKSFSPAPLMCWLADVCLPVVSLVSLLLVAMCDGCVYMWLSVSLLRCNLHTEPKPITIEYCMRVACCGVRSFSRRSTSTVAMGTNPDVSRHYSTFSCISNAHMICCV